MLRLIPVPLSCLLVLSVSSCSLVTVPVETAGGIVKTSVKTVGGVAEAPFKAVGGRRKSEPAPKPAPAESTHDAEPAPGTAPAVD